MNGQLIVAQAETVDTAALFRGSATIDGTVTQSVVVSDGPTVISGHVQQMCTCSMDPSPCGRAHGSTASS